MAIPTILSGAAGRALKALDPVAQFAAGARPLSIGPSRNVINSAGADIATALGATRQPGFSAELHAATQTMVHAQGSASATRAAAGVNDVLSELRDIARTTALKRGAATLALTSGVVGAALLANHAFGRDDAGQVPMAPGRPGDEPTYVSV